MNIEKLLIREEKKLMAVKDKIVGRLVSLRAAITALSTNGHKPSFRQKVHALRGRKLSASHRRAIKLGIARAKKAQA
jgi:hypothetical protein